MPDKELIEKTLNGDQSAFALLLSRYENLIQGLGYKLLGNLHDAQDLTQEVFFNTYKNLPRLKDKTKFRSWIYTITLNLGKNWFKKRGLLHEKIKMSAHLFNLPVEDKNSYEFLEDEQREKALQKILSHLSHGNRLIITLFYLKDYTYEEIANYLKIPLGTVKSRLNETRKKLKEEGIEMVKDELAKGNVNDELVQRMSHLAQFPQKEPEIKISSFKEEDITLNFKKTSPGLLTLYTIPKETYVAFYDWPEKTITNFAYQKLAGKRKINGKNCWKAECWEVEDVFKDESNKSCYDSEWYYTQKEDYFSYIAKNFRQRGEKGKIITSEDKEWDEPRDIKFPVKIKSHGRIKWLRNNKYSGPTAPIGIETAGLWKLELGKKNFKCIRVFQMFWPENRILYETFLDISGRTILGRRYNGPGWKHQGSNVDSLKRKGCPFLEYNNVKFYLYYDVIPNQSI